MHLSRCVLPTPIGDMVSVSSDDGLCALEFVDVRMRFSRLEARLTRYFAPDAIIDRDTPVISRTRAWLKDYFDGAAGDASHLPLDMRGGVFEKRVWQELLRIAPGQTTSYGAIAKSLGAVGASRAVGAANGANPIAIVVPCHRVIGSSGALTGYGGGLHRKTWLLDHERRWRPGSLF